MRRRIADYSISGQTITLPMSVTIEDVRLIVNETQHKTLCSSMQKDQALVDAENMVVIPNAVSVIDNTIVVSEDACTLQPTDQLTIEIDKGDDLSEVENKIEEESKAVQEKIDAIVIPEVDLSDTAKESTLIAESQAIKDKIDNIQLPEIDTTELAKEATLNEVSNKLDNFNVEVDLSSVAKQGENQEATNSAILDVLGSIATTMYKGVKVVHLYPSAGGTVTFTIQPNQYTIIHEIGVNIVLNKGEDLDGIVNHYMVRIENSGGAINTVTFGGFSLKWLGGTAPDLGAKGIFEISIINDLALYTKV